MIPGNPGSASGFLAQSEDQDPCRFPRQDGGQLPGSVDIQDGSAVAWMPYWSTFSKTGVRGDATKATAEKGEAILEAAAEGIVQLVREMRQLEVKPRVDHHDHD